MTHFISGATVASCIFPSKALPAVFALSFCLAPCMAWAQAGGTANAALTSVSSSQAEALLALVCSTYQHRDGYKGQVEIRRYLDGTELTNRRAVVKMRYLKAGYALFEVGYTDGVFRAAIRHGVLSVVAPALPMAPAADAAGGRPPAGTTPDEPAYVQARLPAPPTFRQLTLDRAGVGDAAPLLLLLGGHDPFDSPLPMRRRSLTLVPGSDGDAVRAELTMGNATTVMTYRVSRKDHLLKDVTIEEVYPRRKALTSFRFSEPEAAPNTDAAAVTSDIESFLKSLPHTAPAAFFTAATRAVWLRPGATVPPFRSETLDGKPVTLEAYQGKSLLIHFWGSNCAKCVASFPALKALHQQTGKDVQMLGVSIDPAQKVSDAVKLLAESGADWPQVCDGDGWATRIARYCGVPSTPFFLVIGPDGRVLTAASDVAALRATLTILRPGNKPATAPPTR